MTEKQKLKHVANGHLVRIHWEDIETFTGPTPDGLGPWKGGAKKSPTFGLRARATQTGDWKNTPGKSSSAITERSADYFKQGNNPMVPPLVMLDMLDTITEEPATTSAESEAGDFEQASPLDILARAEADEGLYDGVPEDWADASLSTKYPGKLSTPILKEKN